MSNEHQLESYLMKIVFYIFSLSNIFSIFMTLQRVIIVFYI
jgi:hypothetical protein